MTHDKTTVPTFAFERIVQDDLMPGVFICDGMTVRDIIEEILIIDTASEHTEWANQVWFLPLK
jgi:hypothetical protein